MKVLLQLSLLCIVGLACKGQESESVLLPKGQRPYYELDARQVYGKIEVPTDSSQTPEKKTQYIGNLIRKQHKEEHAFITSKHHAVLSKLLVGGVNEITENLYCSPTVDVVALHEKGKVILDSLDGIPLPYFRHYAHSIAMAFAHRLGRTSLGKQHPAILAFYTQRLVDNESPNPGLMYACLKQLQATGQWDKATLAANAQKIATSCEAFYVEQRKRYLPNAQKSTSDYSRYTALKKQQINQLRQLAAK